MSDVNGSADAVPFEYEGVRYLLPRKPDFDFELAFQAVLEDHAARRVEARRRHMEPADYQAERDGFRRDYTANAYAWGTPAFWTFLATRAGALELALCGFRWGVTRGGAAPAPALGRKLLADEDAWRRLNDLLGGWFPFPKTVATPPPSTAEYSGGSAGSPSSGGRETSSPVTAGG